MAEPVCPPSPRASSPPFRRRNSSAPPSSSRRFHLNIINNDNEVNKLLARANSDLSAYKVRSALALYTEVLDKLSPGHPCALLNRSLCYLTLYYPNLAAIDAYRAILAAHWAKTEDQKTPQTKQILNFGRYTQFAKTTSKHDWVTEPACYVGLGLFQWLSTDLASIAVEPQSRLKVEGPVPAVKAIKIGALNAANDIILKGFYRLALALWKCGGGALKSALDVLSDAQDLAFCVSQDTEQYRDLENAILFEIETVLKDEEEVKLFQIKRNIQTDPKILREYKELGFQGLARTRFTNIKRELYPWDTYSLTSHNQEALAAIDDMVKQHFGECFGAATAPADDGSPPKAFLYAQEDIAVSEPMFEELSSFNVLSNGWDGGGITCDLCASHLKISGDLLLRANRIARDLQNTEFARENSGRDRSDRSPAPSEDSERTRSFEVSTPKSDPWVSITTQDSTDKGEIITKEARISQAMVDSPHNEDAVHGTIESSPHPQHPQPPPDGFQLCTKCRNIALCSPKCRQYAFNIYHKNCCKTGLEQYIRSRTNVSDTWPGVPEPEHQVLLNLLVLRILAHSMDSESHPLSKPWMRGLDGGLEASRDSGRDWKEEDSKVKVTWKEHVNVDLDDLYPERASWKKLVRDAEKTSKDTRSLLPWSFDNNVRIPLRCLFTMGGTELALDTARFDGWVLETMRAKIASNMRITLYPRFDKAFDNDGTAVAEWAFKQDPTPNAYADRNIYSSTVKMDEKKKVIWMASLHPIASLVRVAAEDETPNVQLMERGGILTCVPPAPSTALRPENSKGEGRVDGKDADYESGDSDILLSDSLMDLDFESSPPPVIKAGEPLLRAAEVAPWVLETDIETEVWELFTKKEGSSVSSSAATQTESSILFAGDTMLDADETEWGDDFAMDDEDFEAMLKLRSEELVSDDDEDDDFMDVDGS
ncbi:hypothetical protein BU16DRAFT_557817 [Lophium mytilinum]|uniref:MYND-type zinc finger protein samB n=1 Tax=Lophium mytilinum TaxID=390894 RepID=A0A6A6R4U8_9PEZI|nr:hypothetical protein BU16DRAFT_557817 [Lophium mytilinum]